MSKEHETQQNWFQKRAALKKEMIAKVKEDKAAKAVRKAEVAQMDESARKKAQESDRQAKQAEKVAFKEKLAKAEKPERKALKQERRMYKKIKNRPRRFTLWGLAAALVVFAVVKVGPTVKDMAKVMSGEDINLTSDTEGAAKAREHGGEVAEKISNEGIILLKNEDKHLPLQNKKVNVFGVSAFEFRYGGGGSGGSDTSRAISLFDGLENGGLEVNQELVKFYEGLKEVQGKDEAASSGLVEVAKSMLAGSSDDEPEIAYLTDDALKQAQEYSENAIIVVSSSGVESSDMATEELVLSKNKRELIKKVAENFDNITIVVNSGNTIELGFVEEFPQIKSVVWVGTPGPFGTNSLGKTLSGELNPSGRTTDTYAYANDSAPATENFGDYQYDNLKQAFVNYQEGIYIGYRFYETIYDGDEAAYEEAVQYPFGYGLSYTDFDWKVIEQELTADKIALKVEVENTGDVAGKEVVQVYYSAPYIPGGIEKSAIELGNYAKTDLLAPGEKETVEIEFATRDMASYDEKDAQAYVLDEGKYEIKLGKNVHDITETLDYEIKEKVIYKEDADTKTPYENKFTRSNGGLDYLSRHDWEGTYPSDKDLNYTAPDFVLEELAAVPTDSKLPMPKVEQDNGLKLADLKGLGKDDPKWELFMDQFSLEEMMDFTADGAYSTNAIERLGVPQAVLLDGPAGINFFFKTMEAAAYPTEVVLASTWNNDLAYEMGEAVGLESRELGVHGWYAPGMNLHRTPHGGRNFEYFSEDPVVSGKMASGLISGGQDQGIIVFMKHFAMNDQETNARSGLYVWANEQSIRELHLKPFEMAVKEADVLGTMSSFSMINGTWAGGNSILLNDVLRDEWGFDGFVSTDAVFGFMHANKAVVNGNDLMLDIMSLSKNKKRLKEAYKQDPSGTAIGLRTSTQNVLYTYLQTYLFE